MGAVFGLGSESSASQKDDIDKLGMEGEKVLWLRFILGDLGEPEKQEKSSEASCLWIRKP